LQGEYLQKLLPDYKFKMRKNYIKSTIDEVNMNVVIGGFIDICHIYDPYTASNYIKTLKKT